MSTTVDGVTTNYERNAQGLVTKEYVSGLYRYDTIYSDTLISVREIDLTNGAVASTTRYFLNTTWGGVYKVDTCDALGNVKFSTENTYDGDMSALTHTVFSSRGNSLTYAKGNVASMSTDALNYTFGYTNKGELGTVNKNGAGVEAHTYTETSGKTEITSQYPATSPLYSTKHTFDKYGRLESIDGVLSNVYDIAPIVEVDENETKPNSDNRSAVLSTSTDLLRNETAVYEYTSKGNVIKKTVVDKNNTSNIISTETFEYDEADRLTNDHCIYKESTNNSVTSEVAYSIGENSPLADNRVSTYTYKVNGSIKAQTTNTYDTYKRTNQKQHKFNREYFIKDIEYDYTKPKKIVEKKKVLNSNDTVLGETSYTYDCMGRIASISANGYITSYDYDANGQLIRENNQALDKTFQYVYNVIGNLTSVKTYAYTPQGTAPSGSYTTTSLGYSVDKLTSYNNKAVTYNANGGVASYDGWNYTWNKGKLASITTTSNTRALTPTLSSSKTYSFTYNALGQRVTSNYSYFWVDDGITSIPNGEVTNYSKAFYYDHNGRLISENVSKTYHGTGNDSESIVFLYDENTIIGMVRTASGATNTYYFQRNLLGDVVAIFDVNGNKVVEYAYDAWGNCTIKGTTTNYVVAHANPIRYRGYYYDEDTNLYYLNARYYSPEFRRFISPDDTSYLDYESVNGLNLYCYCDNDPVNRYDPSGYAWEWGSFWRGLGYLLTGVGAIVTGALVIASGVATWPMLLVSGATIGAGALTTINGASEIVDAGTGYNFVEDAVFGGNSSAYNTYATITGSIATLGSIVCGGWYKYNTPRIQAYKNIANATFPGDYYSKNIASRPYFDSILTQKNIIKYGKMSKSIGKNGKIFYEFTAKGTALINGSFNAGMYELVLTSDYKLIWHLLFS